MFLMKKKNCGLCGKRAKGKTGVMQYYAVNEDGSPELFSMIICEACADDLDADRARTAGLRNESI